MKSFFRKLCAPILKPFEAGDEVYAYKKSQRTVLIVVGFLFSLLASVSVIIGINAGQVSAAIPGIVFFLIGGCSLVVGLLGTDRAVSKIWGNK